MSSKLNWKPVVAAVGAVVALGATVTLLHLYFRPYVVAVIDATGGGTAKLSAHGCDPNAQPASIIVPIEKGKNKITLPVSGVPKDFLLTFEAGVRNAGEEYATASLESLTLHRITKTDLAKGANAGARGQTFENELVLPYSLGRAAQLVILTKSKCK